MNKRSFIPGSEWIYYKIYVGPKMADILIYDHIFPIAEELCNSGQVSKWFFIRYGDPEPHLRIRFLLAKPDFFQGTIQKIYGTLDPLIQCDLIWKVQLDTYNRELERYGTDSMPFAESLFYADSIACAQFLALIEGHEGERLRWLYGLRAIDNLLNAFAYTITEKLELLEPLKNTFGREFNMSRPLKKQLDDKYRKERRSIEQFLSFTEADDLEYNPILKILNEVFKKIAPIANQLKDLEEKEELAVNKSRLMVSFIHMTLNRLFKSKNRLNEMVCYDFLYRFYKSKLARSKKSMPT